MDLPRFDTPLVDKFAKCLEHTLHILVDTIYFFSKKAPTF